MPRVADVTFTGIGILGIAAAVPSRRLDNLSGAAAPDGAGDLDHARAVVEATGVQARRQAPPGMCGSDLCQAATARLLADLGRDRAGIDAVIFVSQTPDYRMPATAVLLQDRLGLRTDVPAFDVALGCSGYVYGLYLAFALVAGGGIGTVLLLNGETRTRAYSPRDRATGLLFGDAGAATLVGRAPACGTAHFSLHSDGSRGHLIGITAGGSRHPSSPETLRERPRPDGGFRSDDQGFLDGPGVFTFMISDVHDDIAALLRRSGTTAAELDQAILHQANRFALDHLRAKLGLTAEQVPLSLDEFGNTSGPSIPLTIVTRAAERLAGTTSRVLLSGFGVGLSWASAVLTLDRPRISPLVELAAAPSASAAEVRHD
jgi:3-oxoacyl-[acyl-carrier-protein] synthase-3